MVAGLRRSSSDLVGRRTDLISGLSASPPLLARGNGRPARGLPIFSRWPATSRGRGFCGVIRPSGQRCGGETSKRRRKQHPPARNSRHHRSETNGVGGLSFSVGTAANTHARRPQKLRLVVVACSRRRRGVHGKPRGCLTQVEARELKNLRQPWSAQEQGEVQVEAIRIERSQWLTCRQHLRLEAACIPQVRRGQYRSAADRRASGQRP